MFWTILRRDMLDQILSIRFTVLLIMSCVSFVPATLMLTADQGWFHREMGPLLQEAIWTDGGSWYWINRELPVLQILSTGLGDELSYRAANEGFSGPIFSKHTGLADNPLRRLFRPLDFVFTVNTMCTLMALVFTYDAVSGERQQGTLRLVMTNPVSCYLLVLAKWLGRYASCVLALIPALMGTALVLYLHPDAVLKPSDWIRVGLLFLLALLCLSTFFSVGLFASAVTKTPKASLTVSLALWLLLVLIVPSFSPFLTSRLHPAPTVQEVEARTWAYKQDALQEVDQELRDFVRVHGEDTDRWKRSEKMDYGLLRAKRLYQLAMLSGGEMAHIREDFLRKLDKQAEISRLISFLSPSAAFVFLASDIAGTGIESERDFRRAVLRYRRRYSQYLDQQVTETKQYTKLFRIEKADMPPFEYRRISVHDALDAQALNLVVLLLYNVALLCGTQVALVRSDL